MNLLSNACKFLKEGKITVSHTLNEIVELGFDNEAHPSSSYNLEVKVKYKGIGNNKQEAENLFEQFSKSKIKTNR